MNNKLWFIQSLDLFKGLTKDKLRKIEPLFFMKQYGKREVIFEPGDYDKVFIVKTGQVELYRISADGKKVIIERLNPGSIFGDLGTMGPIDLFVEAISSSYVCSLKRDVFFSMVSMHPELSQKLMKQLFERLMNVEKRMSSIASDSVLNRLVHLLVSLGKNKTKDVVEIPEKLTHEQIAQMLGASRQTITTLFNQLEKKGLIKRVRKTIQFNPLGLEKISS